MKQMLAILVGLLVSAVPGLAHFVFVVPEAGSVAASVLLGETLRRDPQVDVGLVAAAFDSATPATAASHRALLANGRPGH